MKCLISIGQLDKNFIFLLIGGIFKFINFFIIKNKINDHPLILSIGSSFGMSLSFFLLLIYNKRTKNSEIIVPKEKTSTLSKYELEYSDQYKEITYDKYKYIILGALLDFIWAIIITFFCREFHINIWFFDILFLSLFSYIILKIKLYIHHYISIILIIILGIILDIVLRNYNLEKKNILGIIIKFFVEILFSFFIVINKYTMEKKFCSPY